MSTPPLSTVERAIAAHFRGNGVRFVADQYEADDHASDRVMVVVRKWIAADKEHIAWVIGRKVLRVMILSRSTNRSWIWNVSGDVDEDGAALYTFTWIDGHLILVYAGDHCFHLVSIHGMDVTTHSIHGDAVRVMKDRIYTRAFADDAPVRAFAFPKLNEVEHLTATEAEARGVKPISLGLEYLPDHDHYPIGHPGQAPA